MSHRKTPGTLVSSTHTDISTHDTDIGAADVVASSALKQSARTQHTRKADKRKHTSTTASLLHTDIPCITDIDVDLPSKPIRLSAEALKTTPADIIGLHFAVMCRRHAAGETIGRILLSYGMERWALQWLLDRNPRLYPMYYRARDSHCSAIAEETIEIADETANDHIESQKGNFRVNKEAVLRSQLRVKARHDYVHSHARSKMYITSLVNLRERVDKVSAQMMQGLLAPDRAREILQAMAVESQIIESTEMQRRIDALEAKVALDRREAR